MLSPGYTYDKAPDQKHFLGRARSRKLFRAILSNRKKSWKFNSHVMFLEFLMGKREFTCTPWGMPTYNVFGWQKPCYLLQDGYASTFKELMEQTAWAEYGTESGNPRCANCMVHSGYEASGVDYTFGSIRGMWATVRAMFNSHDDADAARLLNEDFAAATAHGPLVQIGGTTMQGADGPTPDQVAKISVADADRLEHAPGFEHNKLEGWVPELATDAEVRDALEKAFDYRGDITVTRKDGSTIEGYQFDRQQGSTLADSTVQLYPKDSTEKVVVHYSEIASLAFTGRDTAAGKSFEAWMKKYWEKKAAGETNIGIESEAL